MPFRKDDAISILAITWGAALSLGLTAALLSRPYAHEHAHPHEMSGSIRLHVQVPRTTVRHIPLEHAPAVPRGFRAVDIEVDNLVTSEGQLLPGAQVDVYNEVQRKAGGLGSTTLPLGEDLLVLANYPVLSHRSGGVSQRTLLTLLVPAPDADRMSSAAADADVLALVRPERNVVVFRQRRR
jgi:hypothetical protein